MTVKTLNFSRILKGAPPGNQNAAGPHGGHNSSDTVSFKEGKAAPFVTTFINQHGTATAMKEALQSKPTEHLHTALSLMDKHGGIDPATKMVRELINKELDDRANRGG